MENSIRHRFGGDRDLRNEILQNDRYVVVMMRSRVEKQNERTHVFEARPIFGYVRFDYN